MGELPVAATTPATSSSSSPTTLHPSSQFEIDPDRLSRAENEAYRIIRKIQPTYISEVRRKEVTNYVKRLIGCCLGAEVSPYGSVPLKTYLPDGDIDLTAVTGSNMEDKLAEDIKDLLEQEMRNPAAEFFVKHVQFIDAAEVKLVKCIVQNVIVDISVNQIGGLATLCFLEKIDRFIGKDHLFKQSILLIKAWCYYESRILGANYGLISTYGLETLVLYIFQFFHSTLDGPLSVLYKFLDYFSKFDWETFCISLQGPVRISSLPNQVAEIPENSDNDVLLSNKFLSSCARLFSVPCRSTGTKPFDFTRKHLNIIDPLKENNNLGRSVSKGNFYRIRSAFSYGAKKLLRILSNPENCTELDLQKFFSDSLARHGRGERPDVHNFYPFSSVPITETWWKITNLPEESSGELINRYQTGTSLSSCVDLATSGIQSLTISSNTQTNGSSGNEESEFQNVTAVNSLFDFSGDYDCFYYLLDYSRILYLSGSGAPTPLPLLINSQFNGVLPPSQFQSNGVRLQHPVTFVRSPVLYPMPIPMMVPGGAYGWEEIQRPRGTGTYFPNMNQLPQGYRPSVMSPVPLRPHLNNGANAIYIDRSPQVQHVDSNGSNGIGIKQELRAVSSSSSARIQPPFSKEQDRIALMSPYRLKDEEEFPPLSV